MHDAIAACHTGLCNLCNRQLGRRHHLLLPCRFLHFLNRLVRFQKPFQFLSYFVNCSRVNFAPQPIGPFSIFAWAAAAQVACLGTPGIHVCAWVGHQRPAARTRVIAAASSSAAAFCPRLRVVLLMGRAWAGPSARRSGTAAATLTAAATATGWGWAATLAAAATGWWWAATPAAMGWW